MPPKKRKVTTAADVDATKSANPTALASFSTSAVTTFLQENPQHTNSEDPGESSITTTSTMMIATGGRGTRVSYVEATTILNSTHSSDQTNVVDEDEDDWEALDLNAATRSSDGDAEAVERAVQRMLPPPLSVGEDNDNDNDNGTGLTTTRTSKEASLRSIVHRRCAIALRRARLRLGIVLEAMFGQYQQRVMQLAVETCRGGGGGRVDITPEMLLLGPSAANKLNAAMGCVLAAPSPPTGSVPKACLRPLWLTPQQQQQPSKKDTTEDIETIRKVLNAVVNALDSTQPPHQQKQDEHNICSPAFCVAFVLQCRGFRNVRLVQGIDENGDAHGQPWVEVYCPFRLSYVSVLPCVGQTPTWNQPYNIAVGRTEVVDVTARYVSKWGLAHTARHDSARLPQISSWLVEQVRAQQQQQRKQKEDAHSKRTEEALALVTSSKEVVLSDEEEEEELETRALTWLETTCRSMCLSSQYPGCEVEERQLRILRENSEPIPNTLTELKSHPLYTAERYLGKREGLYPNNKSSIAGYVKNVPVHYRWAVRVLRTREQWLRRGQLVPKTGEAPYKLVAPPASRALCHYRKLYGRWQLEPYSPQRRSENPSDPIPRSDWGNYELLHGFPAPDGLHHASDDLAEAAAVAAGLEYVPVITGFERVDIGTWVATRGGVVIKSEDAAKYASSLEQLELAAIVKKAEETRTRALSNWHYYIKRAVTHARIMSSYT